jgi:hypothetical protein
LKNYKKLKRSFGVNELGMIDFPTKYSNVRISRIINSDKTGGCSFCFPHGCETTNATIGKYSSKRNWKSYRKNQWKKKI